MKEGIKLNVIIFILNPNPTKFELLGESDRLTPCSRLVDMSTFSQALKL